MNVSEIFPSFTFTIIVQSYSKSLHYVQYFLVKKNSLCSWKWIPIKMIQIKLRALYLMKWALNGMIYWQRLENYGVFANIKYYYHL